MSRDTDPVEMPGRALVPVNVPFPARRNDAGVSLGAAAVGALALGAISIGAWAVRNLALGAPHAARLLDTRLSDRSHAVQRRSARVVRYQYRFECLIEVERDMG